MPRQSSPKLNAQPAAKAMRAVANTAPTAPAPTPATPPAPAPARKVIKTKAALPEANAAPSAERKIAKQTKVTKAAKTPKDKLVRDGFTMPESEFKQIAAIKQRSMAFKREVKKSEVLRAGLKALQGLSEPQLKALLETLPMVKTGRPKKAH